MFKSFLDTHDLYRINFRSDLFPTAEDRAFWERFPNATCVKLAEEAMDYSWPVIKATDFMAFKQSGDRVIMERAHFDRRVHLTLFVLAELKENKGRFLPQIVNGLFAICEESYWGLSAHCLEHHFERPSIPTPADPNIDLFAAETAEHLAMTVTLLQKPLREFCPEILDRVAYELNYRIKEPYESRFDFAWMGHRGKRVNNWNPWILSNILTVFLLCERDARRLQRAVRKMLWDGQSYYDAIPADGGCDEGPHYWGHAGASLFELVYQLRTATDGVIDLFFDEKLQNIARYMQKAHLAGDLFVNVADAHAEGLGPLMPLLYLFAESIGDGALMNFATAVWREAPAEGDPVSHVTQNLRRILFESMAVEKMATREVTLPLHGALELLPEMELATLRRDAWVLAVKGGFNEESHNHNDVGSFVLYDDVTPILIDVGISTYTKDTFSSETRYVKIPWTRGSYHNIPMINGQEQLAGAQYRADRFAASEDRLEISFAGAYTAETGVSRLVREISLGGEGMTLTDSFSFSNEERRSVSEVLMTVMPVELLGKEAILGGAYRLSVSTGSIRMEEIPFEDARLSSDWKQDSVRRILVECEGEKKIIIKVERI